MFHHIKVLWRWGVVTSYLLDLEEVDSIGAFGNDVMELVTDVRARRGARMMLLDDFMQAHCIHAPFKYSCVHHAYPCTYIHAHTMRIMQGFLHSLFEHKWHAFGRYMYWTLRLLDALLLAAIMHLAFELKHAPATCDRRARAGTVLLSNPDPEPNPSPDPSPSPSPIS